MHGGIGVEEGRGRRVQVERRRDVAQAAVSCRDGELRLVHQQGVETLLQVVDVQGDLLAELVDLLLEVFEARGAFQLKLVLQADALLAVLHERVVGFDALLYVPLDPRLLLFPVLLELLLELADPREAGHSL